MTDKRKWTAIQRALDWYRTNSRIADDGSVKTNVDPEFFVATEIILAHAFYNSPFSEGVRRNLVIRAFRRWFRFKTYQSAEDQVSAYLKALEVEKRRLLRLTGQKPSFQILMFLNVNQTNLDALGSIVIQGCELMFPKWNELSSLDTPRLWERVHSFEPTNRIFLPTKAKVNLPNRQVFAPLLVTLEGYETEEVVHIADQYHDILRAALNMTLVLMVFTYFRSFPQPLSKILPSPVYGVFGASGNYITSYTASERFNYRLTSLKLAEINAARRFLSYFDKELSYPETYHHIMRLMGLYQVALDTRELHAAYLSMWRVLEIMLAFGQRDVKNSDLLSRIAILVDFPDMWKDVLPLLIARRNELVHLAHFPERGDDIFFILKSVVDNCLFRLFAVANDLPTVNHLIEFASLRDRPDKDLQRKIDVITKIQKLRTSK